MTTSKSVTNCKHMEIARLTCHATNVHVGRSLHSRPAIMSYLEVASVLLILSTDKHSIKGKRQT